MKQDDGRLPAQPPTCNQDPIARIVRFFETLDQHNCADLARIYSATARFRDPFNDVTGRPAIEAIYCHMFTQLDGPRFTISQVVGRPEDGRFFLVWDFHFRFRRPLTGIPRTATGTTLIELDADGLISGHRDFWDPASGLYEHFPLIGPLLRRLRRHLATPLARAAVR